MTRSRFAPFALPAIALASVLLLSACASSMPAPAATPTGNAISPTPTEAAGEPTPLPTETTSAAGNCEQMIEPDTLAEFKAKGWTYKQKPFVFETQPPSAPLDGGIICTWANYSVSSGNLIDFGWAPITSEKAATAASQLEKDGWRREPADSGYYITQDPAQAINTDDTGHGMTYQFGDGWVAVSDTKQSLLLMPVTTTR